MELWNHCLNYWCSSIISWTISRRVPTRRSKKYNEIMADFDAYASKIVDEQHEKEVREREMRHAIEMQQFAPPTQEHTVTCPYCGSHNCKKIGVGGRAVSVGMTGLASSKIGKQWHCNNCNSDF